MINFFHLTEEEVSKTLDIMEVLESITLNKIMDNRRRDYMDYLKYKDFIIRLLNMNKFNKNRNLSSLIDKDVQNFILQFAFSDFAKDNIIDYAKE